MMQHGYTRYTHGCRCDMCRVAKADYMRAKRRAASARRKEGSELGRYVAPGITHGTYAGYQDAACRCELCTAEMTKYDRRRSEHVA